MIKKYKKYIKFKIFIENRKLIPKYITETQTLFLSTSGKMYGSHGFMLDNFLQICVCLYNPPLLMLLHFWIFFEFSHFSCHK